MSGTLVAGGRRFRLRATHRPLYGGGLATVSLRIPRRALTVARRSLRRRSAGAWPSGST
jgi:hypothetical protein